MIFGSVILAHENGQMVFESKPGSFISVHYFMALTYENITAFNLQSTTIDIHIAYNKTTKKMSMMQVIQRML